MRPAPLVSIITATYQAEPHIRGTIASLRAQKFRDFEWIVVDGGSSDGTLEILNGSRDELAHFESGPDAGIYDAWNKGLQRSRGEWVAFLGAGDAYRATALARYVRFIEQATAADEVPYQYISSRAQLVSGGRNIRVIGRPWAWNEFRSAMRVAHVGSLHHRSLFREQRFDTSYRVAGDYEFLLRWGPRLRAAFIDEVTVEMQAGGVSDSGVLAVSETSRAKIRSGGRHPALAAAESIVALGKGIVRKALWY